MQHVPDPATRQDRSQHNSRLRLGKQNKEPKCQCMHAYCRQLTSYAINKPGVSWYKCLPFPGLAYEVGKTWEHMDCSRRLRLEGHCVKHGDLKASSRLSGPAATPKLNLNRRRQHTIPVSMTVTNVEDSDHDTSGLTRFMCKSPCVWHQLQLARPACSPERRAKSAHITTQMKYTPSTPHVHGSRK